MSLINAIAIILVFVNVGRLHDSFAAVTGALPIGKPLVALGILGLLSAQPGERVQRILRTKQGKAIAIFTVAVLLSVPFSYLRSASMEMALSFMLAGIPIVLVTASSIRQIGDLEKLFKCAVLVVIAYALVFVSGFAVVTDGPDGPRTTLSGAYDPNDLALVTATCMAFCLWATKDRSTLWRVLGYAGLAGGSYVLVRTYSRGGFLAVTTLVLLSTFVIKGTLPGWFRRALVPLAIVGLLASPPKFRERIMTLTKTEEDYNSTVLTGRKAIWRRGVVYFFTRPLTGVGVGQFATAEGRWGEKNGIAVGWKWSAPHNMYVESAAELGILGIGSIISIFVVTLRTMYRRSRVPRAPGVDDPHGRAAGTLFLAFATFAVGATFVTAAFSPGFMFLTSLAIGFAALSPAAVRSRARVAAAASALSKAVVVPGRARATRWQGRAVVPKGFGA